MTNIQDTLRELATFDARGLPVLSLYLDMAPGTVGRRPADTILKDRLNEIERTFLPRGEELDSVRADIQRIDGYLENEAERDAAGLAIFACNGAGLFKAISSGAPFRNQVVSDEKPDIFQLVHQLDDYETAVVAVADTNTLRVFVVASGNVEEKTGRDEDSIHFQKTQLGGWRQARYQRHITKHQVDFANDAASAIEGLIAREGAVRLVLAGDEVVIPLLRGALSPATLEMLASDPLRIDIRAGRDEIAAHVEDVLRAAEQAEDTALIDDLFASVRRGGMGVVGASATREALTRGQVHILFLDEQAGSDEVRAELARSAIATSATVEVVQDDERLLEAGGIGAILRWPLDLGTATETPQAG